MFVFSMHSFALLLNSSNLEQAEGITTNLNNVVTSPTASNFAVSAYEWLQHKLSQQGCLQTDACLKDTGLENFLSVDNEKKVTTDETSPFLDEEQYYLESPDSPFKKHFHDLLARES